MPAPSLFATDPNRSEVPARSAAPLPWERGARSFGGDAVPGTRDGSDRGHRERCDTSTANAGRGHPDVCSSTSAPREQDGPAFGCGAVDLPDSWCRSALGRPPRSCGPTAPSGARAASRPPGQSRCTMRRRHRPGPETTDGTGNSGSGPSRSLRGRAPDVRAGFVSASHASALLTCGKGSAY